MSRGTFSKYSSHGAYHWDALAPTLGTHNAITAARYLQVLRICEPNSGHVILDIGCGDGKLAAMLAEQGAGLVIGIDNERSGIDVGLNRMRDELAVEPRRRVALLHGDAFKLPILQRSCDFVVMTDVIEHVEDALGLTRHAAKVLRPDGKLIVTTPYRATERPLDEHHVREYFPDELRDLLDVHFDDVTILLSDPLWLVELYTMRGWARPIRWMVNALSAYANVNLFLALPVHRYAGQITAVAGNPRD